MICGSAGSRSRLAKTAGRVWSHVVRWEMEKCTPWWREAHVEVKVYKTHHARTTVGSWHVEKVHAFVARSTIRSQKCTKHTMLGPLLEVDMSKKCTPFWHEAHSEVKMYKTHHARTTVGSWHVEKVHAFVARSTFRSQNVQSTPCSDHFWKLTCRKSARRSGTKHIPKSEVQKTDGYGALLDVQMSFCVAGARDCAPGQKWAKCEGFVACPKTMAGVGHLEGICKDACSVAGTIQETCSSEMSGGQGADFLRRVTFGASDLQVCEDDFAWQVQHFVWPGLTFSWQAQYFRHMDWKNRKTHWHEAISSALNFPFLKEVTQNGFVFVVVNFENRGSLAELFRFWRCQVQKLRWSRRIASFLILSAWKIEEVSQNSFVFKLAGRQIDR